MEDVCRALVDDWLRREISAPDEEQQEELEGPKGEDAAGDSNGAEMCCLDSGGLPHCKMCGTQGVELELCMACRRAWYCSEECRTADWQWTRRPRRSRQRAAVAAAAAAAAAYEAH